MPRLLLVVVAGLLACPERKYPERGTELVFKKLDGARDVFERRLAQLSVRARIAEDNQQLSVRLADGVDVSRVKGLLLKPAKLELCEELLSDARGWCAEASSGAGEVSVERDSGPEAGCFFTGTSAAAVKKAAEAKAAGRVLLQRADGRFRSFAVPKTCLSPRFIDGKWKRDEVVGLAVMLTLDTPDARDFEKLTARLVKQRLLIVLDGQVESAPVVMEAIPGGRIQLSIPKLADDEVQVLTAALVGGPLEGLELVEERPYGPPRL